MLCMYVNHNDSIRLLSIQICSTTEVVTTLDTPRSMYRMYKQNSMELLLNFVKVTGQEAENYSI